MEVEEDLLAKWHQCRLPQDIQIKIGMTDNLIDDFDTLPKTSPARTVVIQSLTNGMVSAQSHLYS